MELSPKIYAESCSLDVLAIFSRSRVFLDRSTFIDSVLESGMISANVIFDKCASRSVHFLFNPSVFCVFKRGETSFLIVVIFFYFVTVA